MFLFKHFCLILFIIFTIPSAAQVHKYNPYFVKDSSEIVNVQVFRLTELGQHYYDKTWNAGNIYLQNGDSLFGYYIRYDIVRNSMEIIQDNAFKSINNDQIRAFDWFSVDRLKVEKFVNRKDYGFPDTGFSTFFPEVLEEGEVTLLKVKEIIARQHTASPSLINNEATGVVILDRLFYYRDGRLEEVPGNKKKNLDYFDSEGTETFVRENNFNFNEEADIRRVVRFFNQL